MSYFNMVCDSCGREVQGITWVNGMKFCAKCYQEIFGNQQNKESSELLVNSLAEKDRQITELKKQLKEKEKDNQFLKKMYLSERTKNDNYHTEKYGLDKPVEELRKIKLNPKEKEIYYKGFDNCERQFATQIAELEQQLKSQPAEIVEKIRNICSIEDKCKDGSFVLGINEKDLDNLLKEYQK